MPTFYQHFGTKKDLLFSLVDDVIAKVHEHVFGNDEAVDLPKLALKFYKQWQAHHEEVQWVLQLENKDFLLKVLRVYVIDIKNKFDEHVPPLEDAEQYEDYIIDFVTGGMYMLIKRWQENGMRESPEEMATLTVMLLYNGFSPMRAKGVRWDEI